MRSFILMLALFISVNCHANPFLSNSANVIEDHGVCKRGSDSVDEEKFVLINGIEHWITIKGARCDNPVILFLHGGPANPLSPFADAIYGTWKKEFTLVQWDQRGSGKTFIRNPETAESSLSVEQMAADGIAIAQYLRQHLHRSKLILMGSSWGSVLGIQMVKAQPDLFVAYIGTSQVVSQKENQAASYSLTLAKARAEEDQNMVKSLEDLGNPPWENPRNSGVLRRATKALEAKTTIPAPKTWWIPQASYQLDRYEAEYEAAEEYSFLQFVGMKNDGMYSKIDFPAQGLEFDIPIYFVQGEQDLVTAPSVTRSYFERIHAPKKAYFLVSKTGHNPNSVSVAMEYKILKEQVMPLLKVR